MNKFAVFIKGMIVGVANIIPGVSGGTMAVILNIYDDILRSIGDLTRDWRSSLRLLLPLGLGAGIGIIIFSNVVKWALEHFNSQTNFFFIGLIIGSCPLIYQKAMQNPFRASSLIPFVIALGVMVASSVLMIGEENSTIITQLTALNFFILLISGMIGAATMVIPGISGSFVLLLLGVYTSIITAVADFNIPILIPVGIGVLIGIVGASKLITALMLHAPQKTYFAILGFIIGSIWALYPGITFNLLGLTNIIACLAGFLMAWKMQSTK